MLISEAFSLLGIPIMQDTAAIKAAYRKQLSMHHPETDPEGFMKLHQAYKTALSFAQGKFRDVPSSSRPVWNPEESRFSRKVTDYDDLFADLDANQTADLTEVKQAFSRNLLWLKLRWLPIPLKCWQKLLESEAFRLCRGEQESMVQLYQLMVRKIHTYRVFRFLINKLWELSSFQDSEGNIALANATRSCIDKLNNQYRHYQAMDTTTWTDRLIYPPFWYYQALPHTLKLAVTAFPFPLFFVNAPKFLIVLLFVFHVVELVTLVRMQNRNLGIFHPAVRMKNNVLCFEGRNGVVQNNCFPFYMIMAFVHFFGTLGILGNWIA